MINGVKYDGPTYTEELTRAKAALEVDDDVDD
jgi:hypothetical protein